MAKEIEIAGVGKIVGKPGEGYEVVPLERLAEHARHTALFAHQEPRRSTEATNAEFRRRIDAELEMLNTELRCAQAHKGEDDVGLTVEERNLWLRAARWAAGVLKEIQEGKK